LPDGRVLISFGDGADNLYMSSAELYF
jgi:hypothetical protein